MSTKTFVRSALCVLTLSAWTAVGQVPQPQIPATGDKGVIVVFGASYAKDWPIADIGGLSVVNAGVGGNETRDMLERFERDVLARAPRYVLIWGFINDYTRTPAEKHPQVAAAIEQRLTQMVDLAVARNIRVVLATEVTLPNATSWSGSVLASIYGAIGRTGYADRINKQVMNSNRWLVKFAADRKLPVLDLQAALAPDGFHRDRRYTLPDGSHLNSAAYAALNLYVDTQKDLFSK
jgi:lysophospholipase L1-like esterase